VHADLTQISCTGFDDVLARLLTFPNVIITAHQAFLTREAMAAIAQTTLDNIAAWDAGTPQNRV
jgi:D-lactate dehydrogenase